MTKLQKNLLKPTVITFPRCLTFSVNIYIIECTNIKLYKY